MKIKDIKGVSIVIVALIVMMGVSYGYVTKEFYIDSYSSGTNSVSVNRDYNRDYEFKVYTVDVEENSRITYSVIQTKELSLTIDGITPDKIVARLGDTVNLRIKSEANCNFVIDGYRILARASPGITTEITFNADKLGNYAFRCSGFMNKDVGILEVIK